jgi:pyruvate dehydrogenase E2 component (dihydrolipoyllysine-residue acetyltransferase)
MTGAQVIVARRSEGRNRVVRDAERAGHALGRVVSSTAEMPHEIVMPRLGWASEEGTLIEWLKKDGDPVRSGDIVCIIESDKAQVEVESFDAGVLRIPPTSPAPGAKVPVGTVLGYVLAPGEALPSRGPAPAVAVPATGGAARETAVAVAAEARAARGAGPSASPRARRLAAELRVDWRALKGTGRTGRIVERDVRAAGADRPSAVRRLIGERMSASARTTAPVTLTTDADATALVRLRAALVAEAGAAGVMPPSYTDCFVKLAAVALGEHPALNASLDGERIVQHAAIHVACVLRDVAGKSLRALATESAALFAQARAGTVSPDALRGGTFTVSNLGAFEIDAFTPIINLPECAILGVGRIVARAVVVDETAGLIAARKMVALSLTFDHRVVDGAPAARFLQRIKRLLEQPALWVNR